MEHKCRCGHENDSHCGPMGECFFFGCACNSYQIPVPPSEPTSEDLIAEARQDAEAFESRSLDGGTSLGESGCRELATRIRLLAQRLEEARAAMDKTLDDYYIKGLPLESAMEHLRRALSK